MSIRATSSSQILSKSRYDINLVLPSTKPTECQTVIRNALQSSPNLDIKTVWAETSYGTNLQYDKFKTTKQVRKAIQHDHEQRKSKALSSKDLLISSIIKNSCQNLKGLYSSVQQNSPSNIFNFSLKYLNNTLPIRKNLGTFPIVSPQHCSFLASTFSSLKQRTAYLPCLSNCDSFRPVVLLLTAAKMLYILELTVSFETNISKNSDRKAAKYSSLINDPFISNSTVVFVKLSIGANEVMGSSCNSLLSLLPESHFDKTITKEL